MKDCFPNTKEEKKGVKKNPISTLAQKLDYYNSGFSNANDKMRKYKLYCFFI